jgi:putative transcriptional regulator
MIHLIYRLSDMKTKARLIIENRVHVFRAEHRISQQALADAVGVTRATITAIEGSNYNPSLELAFRIARHFETTVERIFFIKGERHESVA